MGELLQVLGMTALAMATVGLLFWAFNWGLKSIYAESDRQRQELARMTPAERRAWLDMTPAERKNTPAGRWSHPGQMMAPNATAPKASTSPPSPPVDNYRCDHVQEGMVGGPAMVCTKPVGHPNAHSNGETVWWPHSPPTQ